MTTTTSYSKRSSLLGLFRSVLRQNMGICVLYFVLLFLFFPLQYILTAGSMGGAEPAIRDNPLMGNGGVFNAVSYFVSTVLIILAPILFTAVQYSFLYRKKSTDLYHSLPVSRESLLLVNFSASAAMIIGPMLVNYIIVIICGFSFGLPSFYLPGALFDFLFMSIMVLALLAVCTCSCMFSGTAFDNVLCTAAALITPPGIIVIFIFLLETGVHGFMSPDNLERIFALSPISLPILMRAEGQYAGIFQAPGTLSYRAHGTVLFYCVAALLWLLAAAGILALAVFVYRRRKSELAGRTGQNTALIIIAKLAFSFAGGVAFSRIIFLVSKGLGAFWIAAFALLGGALCYCIIECVMSRGFKTLRRNLRFMVFAMALPAVVVLITGTGFLGYETRIPELSEIESVELRSQSRYDLLRIDLDKTRELFAWDDKSTAEHRFLSTIDTVTLSQPEAVELALSIHNRQIAGKDKPSYQAYTGLIKYNLKNGGTLSRSYRNMPPEVAELHDQMNALLEVKHQTHTIYDITAADVREITLMNKILAGITPVALNDAQTTALIEALRLDMDGETYEQMQTEPSLGYIVLTPKTSSMFEDYGKESFVLPAGSIGFSDCYVALTASYKNTLALLAQYGYTDFAKIDYGEIAAINASLEDVGYGSYSTMSLTGPVAFSRDSYKAQNYQNRHMLEDGVAYTSPAEIKTLVELIALDISKTYRGVYFTDDEWRVVGNNMNSESFTMYVTVQTRDNTNVLTRFQVDPKVVPKAIMDKQSDYLNLRYEAKTSDSTLLDLIIRKINEAPDGFIPRPQAMTYYADGTRVWADDSWVGSGYYGQAASVGIIGGAD